MMYNCNDFEKPKKSILNNLHGFLNENRLNIFNKLFFLSYEQSMLPNTNQRTILTRVKVTHLTPVTL